MQRPSSVIDMCCWSAHLIDAGYVRPLENCAACVRSTKCISGAAPRSCHAMKPLVAPAISWGFFVLAAQIRAWPAD